ncbi:MAG TPA: bifunctional N(6)-L-threonylcarbamoyladenine synthase/serine/threonine protein kinase [Acidobacteriota bacterium]|nr:bifunctional N(6)-L-threonylcarbamoyladenine synthase/serine/threonine protein kinase [Acidobacteriota bacterium]
MLTLGIESTAHTFSAAVIKDKKILSNVIKGFTTQSGGMIPSKVADHHVDNCQEIIRQALSKASVSITDIKLISYSRAPGIGHMLRIGAAAARSLAIKHDIPLIGVNHCIAHLEIGRLLTPAKDPILLYVSGANTQVIAFVSGRYRIFGETLDVGIGNFLDTFARDAGLGFPGGPKIAELAKSGKVLIELPYTVKGMDISLSGLQTNLSQKLGKYPIEDLCYSIQETVFAMIVEVAERALAHCEKTEILLGGGVACNTRLREMMTAMCEARGAKAYFVDNQYCIDNAAMIAWQGILQFTAGEKTKIKEADIDPYERTDEVEVTWR